MKHLRPTGTALATIREGLRDGNNSTTTNAFICHACRTHALRRPLHTTRPLAAENDSYFQRMRRIFRPSSEEKTKAREHEEKRETSLQRQAASQDTYGAGLETFKSGGYEYEIAQFVDQASHENYRPAQDAKGLSRIGSEAFVKRAFDRREEYCGFAPKDAVKLTDAQWDNLLHSIAVEMLALNAAKRDQTDIFSSHGDAKRWARTQSVVITPGKNATLSFETPTLQEEILAAIPEAAQEQANERPDFSHVISSEVLDQTARDSSGWSDIPLSDGSKLILLRRISQLTSKRLPDPTMTRIKTLSDLRAALVRPPTTHKLSQSPSLQPSVFEAAGASNVTIRNKYQGWISKEKSNGRWKVIVDELEQRGLPVKGTNWRGAKLAPPVRKTDLEGLQVRQGRRPPPATKVAKREGWETAANA